MLLNHHVNLLVAHNSLQMSARIDANICLPLVQIEEALTSFSMTFKDLEGPYKRYLVLRARRASGIGSKTPTDDFSSSGILKRSSRSHGSAIAVIKVPYAV